MVLAVLASQHHESRKGAIALLCVGTLHTVPDPSLQVVSVETHMRNPTVKVRGTNTTDPTLV